MHTQAQLCHIDADRCVVLVTAWADESVLGSALGEAATAELAEDRALQRLTERLQGGDAAQPRAAQGEQPLRHGPLAATQAKHVVRPTSSVQEQTEVQAHISRPIPQPQLERDHKPPTGSNDRAEQPAGTTPQSSVTTPVALTSPSQDSDAATPSEAPTDPDDWSDELAAVDLEIHRIGWDREQERSYLERAFGHGSRHKLTRYSDLIAYLKRLKLLEPGTPVEAAPVPLRRADLISQGDQMLQSLNWTGDQARQFLHQQLGSSSRQSLSDEQLLSFNMLLENELVSKAS